jgi:hypothetical protein
MKNSDILDHFGSDHTIEVAPGHKRPSTSSSH